MVSSWRSVITATCRFMTPGEGKQRSQGRIEAADLALSSAMPISVPITVLVTEKMPPVVMAELCQ